MESTSLNAPANGAPAAPAKAIPKVIEQPITTAATPAVDPNKTPAPAGDAAAAAPAKPSDEDKTAGLFTKIAEEKAALRRSKLSLEERAAKVKHWEDIEAKLGDDPAVLLEKYPDLYERLTKRVLELSAEQGEVTEADRLAAIEAELAERKKAEADAAEAEKKAAATKDIEAGVASLQLRIDAHPERYELIVAKGAYRDVFDAVVKYCEAHKFNPDGQQLDALVEQTADLIQKTLEEEAAQEFETLRTKAPNFSKRFTTPPAATAENGAPGKKDSAGANGSGSVTLTSTNTSEAPPPRPTRTLTREESMKDAWDRAVQATAARA